MSNLSSINQSILKTIIYFDCLDRAVTAVEVYRYLVRLNREGLRPCHFLDVCTALAPEGLLCRAHIAEKNGYYMLKGREQLYEERIERLKVADAHWKKMQRVAKWFALVPYVRLVMGSGSLGMQHMTSGSDLDVLVVMRHGRIWTGRFLLTILMHSLGVRRYSTHIAGRVCLNHYITDASLHIPFHSLYNAMTYAHLVPIYERINKKPASGADSLRESNVVVSKNDPELPFTIQYSRYKNIVNRESPNTRNTVEVGGIEPPDPRMAIPGPRHATPTASASYQDKKLLASIFDKFQESNHWIKNYLPNGELQSENLRTMRGWRFFERVAGGVEWLLNGAIGNRIEQFLKRAQLKKIERRRETRAPGGRVRADDMMLEFHPNSPERAIIDKFNKNIVQFGLSESEKEADSGLG